MEMNIQRRAMSRALPARYLKCLDTQNTDEGNVFVWHEGGEEAALKERVFWVTGCLLVAHSVVTADSWEAALPLGKHLGKISFGLP